MAGAIRKHDERAKMVFDSQVVTKNAAVTSDEYDVSALDGQYVVQWAIGSTVASAKAKVEFLESINGVDFPKATVLASGWGNTSGSGGAFLTTINDAYGLKNVKIRVTETTNIADLVASVWLSGM